MKKRIAIFVATGFEDIELITPIDIFERQNIKYELFSIENKTTVEGTYNAIVKTKKMNDFDPSKFTALFIPGGAGWKVLDENPLTHRFIKEFKEKEKDLYAICAAPYLLIKNHITDGKKFTCWAGLEQEKSENTSVVVSKNLITGRDYRSSVEFADAIVKRNK